MIGNFVGNLLHAENFLVIFGTLEPPFNMIFNSDALVAMQKLAKHIGKLQVSSGFERSCRDHL